MGEPQPLDLAVRDHATDEMVDRPKCCRFLGSYSCQRRDIEEPAIIDLCRGEPPVGKTIMLALEQRMKPVGFSRPRFRVVCGETFPDDGGRAFDGANPGSEAEHGVAIGIMRR